LIDTVISGADLTDTSKLSDGARARIVKAAVDAFNIEELFPNHNWISYSQESAAASYHSIAALFLRFGDAESAAECLDCSERLEESPRYFALQGLIHKQKGETLGAVASFVSSLQCYEARKVDTGKHYITFKPSNLEVINSRLVDGLNALNKRDNDSALNYFSEAVFNFDPFYAEHGVLPSGKTR
jgi:tetratricopeptide (TPR) repeat protein